jgi:hypothetical protein
MGGLLEAVVPLSARRALAHRRADAGATDDGNWTALAEALEARFFSQARGLKRQACDRRLGALLGRARAAMQDRRAATSTSASALAAAASRVREAQARLAREVVPAERRAVTERVGDLYRTAAREVLDLVRPRRLPFGSHQASPADRDYLLALLESGFSALLEPIRARISTELSLIGHQAAAAAAREAATIGADHAADIERLTAESVRRVEAEVFARADAFVRGYLRGGVVDRFFREDLPRLDLLEDTAYHALFRDSPDLDGEIGQPLGRAVASVTAALARRLDHLASIADALAFDIDVGIARALAAVDDRRRQLSD